MRAVDGCRQRPADLSSRQDGSRRTRASQEGASGPRETGPHTCRTRPVTPPPAPHRTNWQQAQEGDRRRPAAYVLHGAQCLVTHEESLHPGFALGSPQRGADSMVDDASRLIDGAPTTHPSAIGEIYIFEVRRSVQRVEPSKRRKELPSKCSAPATRVEGEGRLSWLRRPPLIQPSAADFHEALARRVSRTIPIQHVCRSREDARVGKML